MELSDELLTGVASIDAEHIELVRRANAFFGMLPSAAPKSELLKALDSLASHAQMHMSAEEELLVRRHYPHLKRHRKAHESLLANIRSINRFIEGNPLNPFTGEFIAAAAGSWITDHIRTHDRDIGLFFRDSGSVRNEAALLSHAK